MGTSKMSREQLQATMKDIWMSIYKKENIRKMMFKTLWRTRNFKAAYWVYGTNHNYGRMVVEDMINALKTKMSSVKFPLLNISFCGS